MMQQLQVKSLTSLCAEMGQSAAECYARGMAKESLLLGRHAHRLRAALDKASKASQAQRVPTSHPDEVPVLTT